jgi:hypothetical protein
LLNKEQKQEQVLSYMTTSNPETANWFWPHLSSTFDRVLKLGGLYQLQPNTMCLF